MQRFRAQVHRYCHLSSLVRLEDLMANNTTGTELHTHRRRRSWYRLYLCLIAVRFALISAALHVMSENGQDAFEASFRLVSSLDPCLATILQVVRPNAAFAACLVPVTVFVLCTDRFIYAPDSGRRRQNPRQYFRLCHELLMITNAKAEADLTSSYSYRVSRHNKGWQPQQPQPQHFRSLSRSARQRLNRLFGAGTGRSWWTRFERTFTEGFALFLAARFGFYLHRVEGGWSRGLGLGLGESRGPGLMLMVTVVDLALITHTFLEAMRQVLMLLLCELTANLALAWSLRELRDGLLRRSLHSFRIRGASDHTRRRPPVLNLSVILFHYRIEYLHLVDVFFTIQTTVAPYLAATFAGNFPLCAYLLGICLHPRLRLSPFERLISTVFLACQLSAFLVASLPLVTTVKRFHGAAGELMELERLVQTTTTTSNYRAENRQNHNPVEHLRRAHFYEMVQGTKQGSNHTKGFCYMVGSVRAVTMEAMLEFSLFYAAFVMYVMQMIRKGLL